MNQRVSGFKGKEKGERHWGGSRRYTGAATTEGRSEGRRKKG